LQRGPEKRKKRYVFGVIVDGKKGGGGFARDSDEFSTKRHLGNCDSLRRERLTPFKTDLEEDLGKKKTGVVEQERKKSGAGMGEESG